MLRCVPLALLGVVSVAAATQSGADTCTAKLQQVCGAARSAGQQVCDICLETKQREIGWACYGHRSELDAFCKVPDCDSTLAKQCGSVRGAGTECSACAGSHQGDLQNVNCTEASIQAFCTPGINPLYKQNITVYHVNPESYGLRPIDMNTGDAHGDMFFDIKSVATPLECSKNKTAAGFAGFDCSNAEVTSPDLSITKLVLEVDTRYTSYSMCNICINCTVHPRDPRYRCPSTPGRGIDPLNRGRTCAMTPRPEYVCDSRAGEVNASVGRENVTAFFSRMKPGQSHHSYHHDSESEYWQYNTVMKTGGWWYSTLANGMCNASSPWCTWRVAAVAKRVSKRCADASLYAWVERHGDCFGACGTPRNTSSPCWIRCFYDTVLGKGSNESDVSAASVGMTLAQLDQGWQRPFLSSDPAAGGCPDTAGAPPSPPPAPPTPAPAVDCNDKYTTRAACDADAACAWCASAAVPSACNTLADARGLPPAVFTCDKV